MAISESPEIIGATAMTTAMAADYGDSVRRRASAAGGATVRASTSSSMAEESEDLKKVSNGEAGDRIVDGADNNDSERNNSDNVNGEGEAKVVNGGGAQDFETAIRYSYRPSSPAHRKIKESPLSSDAIFRQSHAGLFNLCVVVLVAVNSRLIIENLMKYGLLIRAGFWFSSKSFRDWPIFMCCLSLPIFPFTAFLVEKLSQRRRISDPVVVLLHILISTITILYPVFVILRCDSAVLSGVILMLFACTMWLKLVSYAHTNYDMRAIAKASIKEDELLMELPYDVSIESLVYFMVAPTLCYQTSYPRTACIRKGWVARQVLKLVIFTGVMGFIVEQYINPIVQNSQHPLKANLLYAIERILKLSVPNLYVWLCMFYCFFHLWLNILAELLKFGDREFYKDWWNARTFEEYWRMWNMPVHKWMVRHVYFPCLRNGIPKGVAVLIAFLISAIFHELCIAVPCQMFKLWAFLGIMFQVPLVLLTNFLQRKFQSSMVGNMIFWFIFSIFGQPMCVLLYYHDLMNRIGKSS
ncbi:diacylglycerol O-acyltransferase 1A-like [Chenopodium quinoa]|uniref:diacylglycerol O-acyltransferase 1A-like n=1 Tax=Chenopodium quinoa TaxID=63459 RepID=UPI000B783D2A|nr:diacylglycerol O-acyltransferase 1A-like [Chenopodium quinoa]